ncbi:ABC transporter substrate-binding protein [Arenivirga flava]|uniref:ABC transporter substrate-binding protein n=1 Tax=Arenivirga flava TaxID=1930060 RepID=A0AA37X9Z0_9MICO|nr:ABC transporter substrate-binding protein [Arenivirga flava]GMA27253.1 ABC transporter substrate-binding protein [Arenivirga flava]
MRPSRLLPITAASAALALGLVGCASGSGAETGGATGDTVTIEHALGTVEVPANPERVATVAWANHEVPLALGVVPVGMAAANFGDDDGDGLLPWVSEKLEELGAETPVLFDETDGIDFEAVADTDPDVILAGYSGLTQEDYDTLSEIAPVVAYPEGPWATSWRELIEINAAGIGRADEGEQLIADIEAEIAEAAAEHPELEGKTAGFITHIDPTDLSEISYYTTADPRPAFFEDLGLVEPAGIAAASEEAGDDVFSLTQSAEQADFFDDVDIVVTYGTDLLTTLQADPLLSQIPAVQRESFVQLDGTGPLGTAANPTPLAISWVLDDYLELLAEAAAKVDQ